MLCSIVLYIRLTLLLSLFSVLIFQQLPGNTHKETTKKALTASQNTSVDYLRTKLEVK